MIAYSFSSRLNLIISIGLLCILSNGVRLKSEKPKRASDVVAPVVFIPGITSSPLEARRIPGKALGLKECESSIPKSGWYPLYVSAARAMNPGCLLWQLQLQQPQQIGPDGEECVQDAEGLEIREVGFGTTKGAEAINPGDPVPFKLFEKMIKMFESIDLERAVTIRYATYDWRKHGDACWERKWFARLQELIEKTATSADKPVNLACHSMGCPLAHVFLNSVSSSWKREYIQQFVAAGPAFGGASAILQNFIEGPTYDLVPLAFSTLGRATMNSFPGVYSLLPTRLGNSWADDMVIISTPWKNYTLESVYDGTFWRDVEAPEKSPDLELRNDMQDFDSRKDMRWHEIRNEIEDSLTEQGCVCASKCETTLGGPLTGVLDNGNSSVLDLSRPWCFTHGNCGSWTVRLRGTLNPFGLLQFPTWDFCGGDSKALDAGPGFEFFPGVTTERSNILFRIFGIAESYDYDASLQIEEQKARCLSDPECTGFDTEGYLKRGKEYHPDKTWRGLQKVKNGVVQGLYMKRPSVQRCQKPCNASWFSADAPKFEVCGNDGITYTSECHLNNAKCWKKTLHLKGKGSCRVAYRTPMGCVCKSACGAKKNRQFDKGCYVQGECGRTSYTGKRWDLCMDADGIDTGMGFEYFPRVTIPDAHILRKPAWFQSFHLDQLQQECGMDPKCGGFSTDGNLYGHEIQSSTSNWRLSVNGNIGVYRKRQTILDCQRSCGDAPKAPVCYETARKTFDSACDADNFRCLLQLDVDEFKTFPRPCQRYGNTGLHTFGQEWVQRMTNLRPPGVPTTCMYITDVDTPVAWRYRDFMSKGQVMETAPGDGTVSARSAEGPCRSWAASQEPSVNILPLKLGGASHVSMLFDHGFLDALKRVLLQDDMNCVRVSGGVARVSVDPPMCKCSGDKMKVFCGAKLVDERRFDLTHVLQKCDAPYCASCGMVAGAIPRSKEDMPLCKCKAEKTSVFCDGRIIADRHFHFEKVFGECESPVCAENL